MIKTEHAIPDAPVKNKITDYQNALPGASDTLNFMRWIASHYKRLQAAEGKASDILPLNHKKSHAWRIYAIN